MNLKRIIIALLLFVISTVLIYMICTISRLFFWCNENQIVLFNTNISDEYIINNINKDKLNEIGEIIGNYANALDSNKDNKELEGDRNFYLTENGNVYAIAKYFNPLGYSIWIQLQGEFATIFSLYIEFSIFAGLTIALIYLVIFNNKINYILKFTFGYFGIIIIVPQIYYYSIAHHFGGIDVYSLWNVGFYIFYTIVFILIFSINYAISERITKKLNKTINASKFE